MLNRQLLNCQRQLTNRVILRWLRNVPNPLQPVGNLFLTRTRHGKSTASQMISGGETFSARTPGIQSLHLERREWSEPYGFRAVVALVETAIGQQYYTKVWVRKKRRIATAA